MPQSTGESFITKRIIIGPQDEASVVVQIALDLLSNFDSHQEDECLGRFTSCILQICQCSNMILICHVVGAKLGAYRNTESYPDLFSIYIYIHCLETTTRSCSSSAPKGQPKVFQAIPNPKSSKIPIFSCYYCDQ